MTVNRNKISIIKELNKNKIINLLASHGEMTKFDISNKLGISIPTVTTNINRLKSLNLVHELESTIYTGGRKPKVIHFNSNARISIGIRITLYNIDIVMLNLKKDIVYIESCKIKFTDFNEFMKWSSEKIDSILEEKNIPKKNLLGVGISIPGIINKNTNTIEYTNVGISNANLDFYNDMYEYNVYYENEANLSILNEKNYIDDKNKQNLLFLSINIGLGGGILINNEIYSGSSGRSGEFGHMKLMGKGKDYLDDYLSTSNIVKTYNLKSKTNQIETFKEFEQLVINKNKLALSLMDTAIERLALCIYNLIAIFDPSSILIGGEFSFLLRLYKEDIIKLIQEDIKLPYSSSIEVLFSKDIKSDLIGAALLPLNEFFKLDLQDI
ncbi:ROK family transcriptional regulator [Terrisporobacter sp.]|uniref:ROK family transcriptional regulator n=1 Tax=Terrisporobacter sp. TaxID=1965305 RepID=UPI002635FF46|nr:ROK family transcriptional regulator [Terrisporobacter sp.]